MKEYSDFLYLIKVIMLGLKIKLAESKWWYLGPEIFIITLHNEIQGPHVFFYSLLVMLGNYEPTCIATI